jgi:hypothetical protein
MTGSDDLFNVLGKLEELSDGVAAKVRDLGIPEMLKEAVESGGGFELFSEPLRQVMSGVGGLGGLGELLGPDIIKVIGDLSGTVKDLLDHGDGPDIVQQVTKTVSALLPSNPPKGDAGV